MSAQPSRHGPEPEPPARPQLALSPPPPLESGDRLSRAEFERIYEAHPEIKKAELVEGVVYVPSPVRADRHGEPHAVVAAWAVVYSGATPGVRAADNATVWLDHENEPQPDVLLFLDPALGGKARVNDGGYIQGPPELVIEVAARSASYDLHDKKRAYQRNGVAEYVVVRVLESQVDWFVLRDTVYQTLQPDEAGVLKSEVFAGLWLQPTALWPLDIGALLGTLQQGLASPEHAAFVERLQATGGQGAA